MVIRKRSARGLWKRPITIIAVFCPYIVVLPQTLLPEYRPSRYQRWSLINGGSVKTGLAFG